MEMLRSVRPSYWPDTDLQAQAPVIVETKIADVRVSQAKRLSTHTPAHQRTVI